MGKNKEVLIVKIDEKQIYLLKIIGIYPRSYLYSEKS